MSKSQGKLIRPKEQAMALKILTRDDINNLVSCSIIYDLPSSLRFTYTDSLARAADPHNLHLLIHRDERKTRGSCILNRSTALVCGGNSPGLFFVWKFSDPCLCGVSNHRFALRGTCQPTRLCSCCTAFRTRTAQVACTVFASIIRSNHA
jgi:hypothetical protein